MLMSNFGSITGVQDQQTLLTGSASKISFSFLSLNCFRARNAVAGSKHTGPKNILSTETQNDNWWGCGMMEVLLSDLGRVL